MRIKKAIVDKILSDIREKAKQHNVRLILNNTKSVKYPGSGFLASGYFIDYGHPTLAVAMNNPTSEWIMVLLHESSHMDQWIEKSPFWTKSFIKGRESVDYLDEWINGKELTKKQLKNVIKRSREVEWDCEMRTIEKAKKYGLPNNLENEIKKANSYIWLYTLLEDTRKWTKSGKSPYKVKQVWSKMPKTFNIDYNTMPEDVKKLYLKYCY